MNPGTERQPSTDSISPSVIVNFGLMNTNGP